jgi:polar amino acid transport system substrate-binding protein
MLKSWRELIAATVTLIVLATPGWAAGTLDAVKQRGALIAGVKADFPPFGFMDEGGQRAGYDIDMAREIAQILLGSPDKVQFVTVTSANRIPMLQTTQVDVVIASMTITAARKEVIDFSVPYFCSGHLILTKASNTSIAKFSDLNGLQVATVQGATGDRVTSMLAPQAKRVTFGQNSEALLALKDGRVEAFVQDDVLLLAFAKQDPSLKVVGWPPQMPGPYGMGLRKGDKDLLGAINVTLAQIRTKGIYDKLFDKWFGGVARNLLVPKACPAELVLP